MSVSTIHTVLKFGTSASALEKLCAIKDYPDMMGSPEQIETTDLDCEAQTFVAGVKSMDSLEFTANYDLETYKTMQAKEGTAGYFQIEFGESGVDGKFQWQGTYNIGLSGGDVNAVREMKITCTPSTEVALVTES